MNNIIKKQEDLFTSVITPHALARANEIIKQYKQYKPKHKPPMPNQTRDAFKHSMDIVNKHELRRIVKEQGAGDLPIVHLFSARILNNIKTYDLLGDRSITEITLADLAATDYNVFPFKARNFGKGSIKEIETVLEYHGIINVEKQNTGNITKFEYENALRIVAQYEKNQH